MVASLTPTEAARLAYEQAKAATNAARARADALPWGAPGEDEAWQALERCQAVEKARYSAWLALTDGDRENSIHTPMVRAKSAARKSSGASDAV